MNARRITAVLALLTVAAAAQADSTFQHPATGARVGQTNPLVASDTVVLVGHPASPTWKRVHANADHPAVSVAARGAAQAPDANHFLVQPPAAVHWALKSEPELQLAGGTK